MAPQSPPEHPTCGQNRGLPDSSFAISRVSGKGRIKAHVTYVKHLREFLQRVKDTYLAVTVHFHKVAGHSDTDDCEARGNKRVDSLGKTGTQEYVPIPLPRPRLPPSVPRRRVGPLLQHKVGTGKGRCCPPPPALRLP